MDLSPRTLEGASRLDRARAVRGGVGMTEAHLDVEFMRAPVRVVGARADEFDRPGEVPGRLEIGRLGECGIAGLAPVADGLVGLLGPLGVVRKDFGLPLWQDHVFDFMARNAARADAFYHLPPERVVELGIQVEI